jgi:hypothetical protein
MYAIGEVIYGFPITEEICDVAEALDEELGTMDGGRFYTAYHGSWPHETGYFGVRLARFDELSTFLLSDITAKPTEEQKKKVLEDFEKLPKEYQDAAQPIGTYVVWFSS